MRYGNNYETISIIEAAEREKQRVRDAAFLIVEREAQARLKDITIPYMSWDMEKRAFVILACWTTYGETTIDTGHASIELASPVYEALFLGSLIPVEMYRQMTLDQAIAMAEASDNRIEL